MSFKKFTRGTHSQETRTTSKTSRETPLRAPPSVPPTRGWPSDHLGGGLFYSKGLYYLSTYGLRIAPVGEGLTA